MKTKHNKMVLELQKLFKNNSKRTYTRKFSLNISQARSGIKSCPPHPFHALATKKRQQVRRKENGTGKNVLCKLDSHCFFSKSVYHSLKRRRKILARSAKGFCVFSALSLPFSFRNAPHKNLRVQDRLPGIILTVVPKVSFQNIQGEIHCKPCLRTLQLLEYALRNSTNNNAE